MCRYLILSAAALSLSACYLQGSSCSGPFCFSVATDIDGTCRFDCNELFRCPDADTVRANSLSTLNLVRQSSSLAFCGGNFALSDAGIVWNETLFSAADRHARDMAANNFVAEIGSDGLSIDSRVAVLDGSFSNVSQLVAGGFASSQALIDEWLRQPEDCVRLLDSSVTQYAMACRFDQNTDFGTYWSLVLATE